MINLVFAAALVASYDCEVEAPQMVQVVDGKASLVSLGLPPELKQWKFGISIVNGDPIRATVDWPGNPLHAAGNFPGLKTSKASYAFTAYSSGPCLFTESGCLTQFNLVDNGDRTANVIVSPSAIATISDKGGRMPFMTVIQGKCSRTDKK